MLAKDLMTHALEKIPAEATLVEAAKAMEQHDVGCLIVEESGQAVGIVTDRDIVIRSVSAGVNPADTRISEVMTANPVFCRDSDTIQSVAQIMERNKVRRLVVRDSKNKPVGMISVGDLASRAHEQALAGEVMERVCGGR